MMFCVFCVIWLILMNVKVFIFKKKKQIKSIEIQTSHTTYHIKVELSYAFKLLYVIY